MKRPGMTRMSPARWKRATVAFREALTGDQGDEPETPAHEERRIREQAMHDVLAELDGYWSVSDAEEILAALGKPDPLVAIPYELPPLMRGIRRTRLHAAADALRRSTHPTLRATTVALSGEISTRIGAATAVHVVEEDT